MIKAIRHGGCVVSWEDIKKIVDQGRSELKAAGFEMNEDEVLGKWVKLFFSLDVEAELQKHRPSEQMECTQ